MRWPAALCSLFLLTCGALTFWWVTSSHSEGLVRNLLPGRPYVFRLVVSNRAGTSTGPSSMPIKTLPRPPAAPREDPTVRTDTTIGLKFEAAGTSVTKLTLQYAILAGKVTFDNLKANGVREPMGDLYMPSF